MLEHSYTKLCCYPVCGSAMQIVLDMPLIIVADCILGINDQILQQKLVLENPPYIKIVEICRASEQGKESFTEIQDGCSSGIDAVKSKVNCCLDVVSITTRLETVLLWASNAPNAEATFISHVCVKDHSHNNTTKDQVYKKFK